MSSIRATRFEAHHLSCTANQCPAHRLNANLTTATFWLLYDIVRNSFFISPFIASPIPPILRRGPRIPAPRHSNPHTYPPPSSLTPPYSNPCTPKPSASASPSSSSKAPNSTLSNSMIGFSPKTSCYSYPVTSRIWIKTEALNGQLTILTLSGSWFGEIGKNSTPVVSSDRRRMATMPPATRNDAMSLNPRRRDQIRMIRTVTTLCSSQWLI